MEKWLSLSALELAKMIRSRKVSSETVVKAHIEQIKNVNKRLNAVVQDRFDEALREARKADHLLGQRGQKNNLPPLFGVPCTIKESFSLKGMPNTAGLVSKKGKLSRSDAVVVSRLKKAGAIPLGVTNVSELCMWIESNNHVYGRSNNPYNPYRIVGGSSGGEGAIVGAGGSPFGLASDIAGSIRLPAFFNGVFGHKPTGGMVPTTGHFPVPTENAKVFSAMGPIARRAEDLMPLLKIIAGPDGKDRWCKKFRLGDVSKVRLKKLNVISVPHNSRFRIHGDLMRIQDKCTEALATEGASIQHTEITALRHSFKIWSSMMCAAEETTFSSVMGNGKSVNLLMQLIKWPLRFSPHTLPAIGLAFYEKIFTPLSKYIRLGDRLRAELIERIGPNGVMVFPSFTSTAPLHYSPMLRPFDWVLTGIFNVLEFPVTQVPLGLDRHNLPLGIQVVGTPGNDHITIAVAMELERLFGGWVPPEPDIRPHYLNPLRIAGEIYQDISRLLTLAPFIPPLAPLKSNAKPVAVMCPDQ